MHDFLADKRFEGLKSFENKLWLSSPTMHGEEQKWVDDLGMFRRIWYQTWKKKRKSRTRLQYMTKTKNGFRSI